jgi:hypothetical protein
VNRSGTRILNVGERIFFFKKKKKKNYRDRLKAPKPLSTSFVRACELKFWLY